MPRLYFDTRGDSCGFSSSSTRPVVEILLFRHVWNDLLWLYEVICKAEKGRGLRLRTAHPVTLLSLRVALLSLRNRSAKGDQRRSDAESLQLMVGCVRKGRELKRLDYHLSMIRVGDDHLTPRVKLHTLP